MKPLLFATALLAATTSAAFAHDSSCLGRGIGCRAPLHWSQRHDAEDARIEITSTDGKIALVMTGDVVAMQLSDDTMHRVDRKLHRARREQDDDDTAIGSAVKAAVLSAVRSLLDHSAECPLREIRDVRYEDGRLVFVTRGGRRLFERFEVQDRDVLESFDPADARAFVSAFHQSASPRW